jgi:enoyl-CoA hydratase/3-hydroxyacyl-CoA dehydrogenase
MVASLANDHQGLIQAALDEINNLQGKVTGIPPGKVDIPDINIPDEPMAGRQLLSKEAVTITAQIILRGVATENLAEALEVGYRGFGEIACTDAAKEGISAFLERRKPDFKK